MRKLNHVSIKFNNASSYKFKAGLVHLVEHVLVSLSPKEYYYHDQNDMRLYAYTYHEFMIISIESKTISCNTLLKHLLKIINRPITEEKLNHEKQIILSEIKQKKNIEQDIFYKIVNKNRLMGTKKSLDSINLSEIKNFVKNNLKSIEFDYVGVKPDISLLKNFTIEKPVFATQEYKKEIFDFMYKNKYVVYIKIQRTLNDTNLKYIDILDKYFSGSWTSKLNYEFRVKNPILYYINSEKVHFDNESYIIYIFDKDVIKKTKEILSQKIDKKIWKIAERLNNQEKEDEYMFESNIVYDRFRGYSV